MSNAPYDRRLLKFQAKQTLFRFMRPCVACACLLLCFTVLAQIFTVYTGGAIFSLFLDVRQFPMETGLFQADPTLMTNLLSMMGMGLERQGDLGGLVLALRDVLPGQVLVLPIAWRQLMDIAVIQGIVFLVTVPLQYGVLRQFRLVVEGRPQRLARVFLWYTDLRRTLKALAVQVVLTVWRIFAILLCGVPSLLCLAAGYLLPNGDLMLLLSTPVSILGMLLGYYLYTLLLPARYVLAKSPEVTVGQALSQGFRLLEGRRLEYFKLNLSFLPWRIISMFLQSLPDLFVVPYMELSNFLFLDPPETPEAPPVAL